MLTGAIKNVFVIIGTLVVSLLFFTLAFGYVGKDFMWENLEPVYKAHWDRRTNNDGEKLGEVYTSIFDSAEEIHH